MRTKIRNGRAGGGNANPNTGHKRHHKYQPGDTGNKRYHDNHKHLPGGIFTNADSLNNSHRRPSKPYMKKYICLLMGAALLAACEQKETTVTNPPSEKKESNTTIVKESPAPESKTETKTNINVTTSPSP